MEHLQNLKIAVDFDGTLVEHEYPKIGKDILFAFETLKELQKHGALLILWTIRAGQELDEALDYCRNKGIEFYAINKNYPEEEYNGSVSRKINADVYIDDKNVGGFPGWSIIWQQLSLYDEMEKQMARQLNRRKSLFRRLFRKLQGRDKSL
jgi:hydroxymethylpyrimidine pyrophosphatase-like HAD family hydrolase